MGLIKTFYFWSKVLTAPEVMLLQSESYAMFKTGLAQLPYMNFGTAGGEPPVTVPHKPRGQSFINVTEKTIDDRIAWRKE